MSDFSDIQQNNQHPLGARRKIFSVNESEFIFLNKTSSNAYTELSKRINQASGIFTLTGEAGIGKSFLLHKLENEAPKNLIFICCYSTNLDYENLIAVICDKLEINTTENYLPTQLAELKQFLIANSQKGINIVLVIDDAHHLGEDVLSQLIALYNLELDGCALRLVLSGTPMLELLLEKVRNQHALSVDITQVRLEPLAVEDIAAYVSRQIKNSDIVDFESLFSPTVIKKIARYTGGIPRLINALCERALVIAQLDGEKSISIDSVSEAANELMMQERDPLISRKVPPKNYDDVLFDKAVLDETVLDKTVLDEGVLEETALDKTIFFEKHQSIKLDNLSGLDEINTSDKAKEIVDGLLLPKENGKSLDQTVNDPILQSFTDYPVATLSFTKSNLNKVKSPVNAGKLSQKNTESRKDLVEKIMEEELQDKVVAGSRSTEYKQEKKSLNLLHSNKIQFLSLVFFALLAGLLGGLGSAYLFNKAPDHTSAAQPPSSLQVPAPAALAPGPVISPAPNSAQDYQAPASESKSDTNPSLSLSTKVDAKQTAQAPVAATGIEPSQPSPPPASAVHQRDGSTESTPPPGADPAKISLKQDLSPPAQEKTTPTLAPVIKPKVDNQLIVFYMNKGDSFLRRGDIVSARLFYQEAVKLGYPEAMAAVAKTYDPAALANLGVKGFRDDPAKAAEWYLRAKAAGYTEGDSYQLQELRSKMPESAE